GDVPMAVEALRDGAFDFITKPFGADHLIASVRRAIERRRLVLDNRQLREAAAAAEDSHPLMGETAVMVQLRDSIAEIARCDFDVLIEGETGTGKDLVALLLHRAGPRRGRPFVAINAGALSDRHAEAELFGTEGGMLARTRGVAGRIESAHRGTLFLDEIDSMAMGVQVMLLRVLEEREVTPLGADTPRSIDMRVIAAAKHPLEERVRDGSFRGDLFHRLNVIRLRVPPLRERRADIPLLFAHFLAEAAEQIGRPAPAIDTSARRHLLEYDWPGNVRELRNFARRTALGIAEVDKAPVATQLSLAGQVDQFEASILRETLTNADGDVRTALALLGIARKTFYDKLARHGINPGDFRPRTANRP
ncbi:MAG: Fis family transcriptional regulator, partial [Sphingomonas bacterium]|uniref:sigma-54-dependent transcriptional regulator n=1 Tax=Sphingomonas bacterium TaxID=1895847 RepID=UPI00261C25C1